MAQPMATDPNRRSANAPLYDTHPRTGATIEVFFADRVTGNIRQVRRWLVLVASPARLFAIQRGDGALRHEPYPDAVTGVEPAMSFGRRSFNLKPQR